MRSLVTPVRAVAFVGLLLGLGRADAGPLRFGRPYLAAFPSDGSGFGSAIAVRGAEVMIGAPFENGDGAIYVFDAATGEQRLRIVGEGREHLGSALAVLGGDIVAGAPGHPDGATIDIGSVMVFDRASGLPRLALRNPALIPRRFGASVITVDGDLLVGAPGAPVHPDTVEGGAAYLFDGVTGTLLRTFRSPTATANDHFGFSLATLGRDVAIGAPEDDAVGRDAGAVFMFDATTGHIVRALHSPVPRREGGFGVVVAADGSDLVVGAPEENAAYVFDGRTGELLQVLVGPPRVRGMRFGSSLAMVGTHVVVGSPGFGKTGAAYVFDRSNGRRMQTLLDPEPKLGGRLGEAFGIGPGAALLVGAPLADAGADAQGIVWRFADNGAPCGACESREPLAACRRLPGCMAEVWLLGDSITAIYAPRLPSLEPRWRVHNLGQPGEASPAGVERLRALLAEADTLPDVAVLLYGTNDIGITTRLGGAPRAGADIAAAGISDIVALLRERGVKPVVGLPLDVPDGAPLPPEERDVAAKMGVGFARLRTRLRSMRPVVDFRLRRPQWYVDLVHPNGDGALVLAERARRAVRRALARHESGAPSAPAPR